MSERKLFNEWLKYYEKHDVVIDQLQRAFMWQAWQASANREGYKFVPMNDTNIMDMIHGKCPCGSSRAPIISDKEGYNLIHCFACGANKYIHEDY